MKLEEKVEKGFLSKIRNSKFYQKAANNFIKYAVLPISLFSGYSYAAQKDYFPQIINGPGIKTGIVINNPGAKADSGVLSLKDKQGNPWSSNLTLKSPNGDIPILLINGEYRFSRIPGGGVLKFETDGSGAVKVGHGSVVYDNVDSVATASAIFDLGNSMFSAYGVPASLKYNTVVEKDIDRTSGIALSNFNDKDISLLLRLLDSNGNEFSRTNLTLRKGEQSAKLLEEMFNVPVNFQGSLHATTKDGEFSMLGLGLINPNRIYALPGSPTAYELLVKANFEGLDVFSNRLNAELTKWLIDCPSIKQKEYQGNPISLEIPIGDICEVNFSNPKVFDEWRDLRINGKLAESVEKRDVSDFSSKIKFDNDVRIYGVAVNNDFEGEVGPRGHVITKDTLKQSIGIFNEGRIANFRTSPIKVYYYNEVKGPDAVLRNHIKSVIDYWNARKNNRKLEQMVEVTEKPRFEDSINIWVNNRGPNHSEAYITHNVIKDSIMQLNDDNFNSRVGPLSWDSVAEEIYEAVNNLNQPPGIGGIRFLIFKNADTNGPTEQTRFGEIQNKVVDEMPNGMDFDENR